MQMQKQKKTPKTNAQKAQKVRAAYQAMTTGGGLRPSEKLALMHSRYLNSILDPLGVPGAKVPDEVTAPSFTAQLISKFTLTPTTPASGPVAAGLCKPVGQVGTTLANFFQVNGIATSSNYQSSALTGTWTGGTSVVNVANLVRPVSAAIYACVQGTSNTNQGRLIVGFIPPNDPLSALLVAGTPVNINALLTGTYVTDVPASKGIARAIWLPTDDIARSYSIAGNVVSTAARGGSSSLGAGGQSQYGGIFALYDGALASGPATVEVTVVENLEIIPVSAAANIMSPTASHSDPLELAATANFLSAHPRVAVEQPLTMSITGSADSGMRRVDSGGPSFLDSVLSGVEKVAGAAQRVAPIAASLLGML